MILNNIKKNQCLVLTVQYLYTQSYDKIKRGLIKKDTKGP